MFTPDVALMHLNVPRQKEMPVQPSPTLHESFREERAQPPAPGLLHLPALSSAPQHQHSSAEPPLPHSKSSRPEIKPILTPLWHHG